MPCYTGMAEQAQLGDELDHFDTGLIVQAIGKRLQIVDHVLVHDNNRTIVKDCMPHVSASVG